MHQMFRNMVEKWGKQTVVAWILYEAESLARKWLEKNFFLGKCKDNKYIIFLLTEKKLQKYEIAILTRIRIIKTTFTNESLLKYNSKII